MRILILVLGAILMTGSALAQERNEQRTRNLVSYDNVAIDLIAEGRAPVERLVTHRFPLAEAPEAFRTAADKSTGSVKVQLFP